MCTEVNANARLVLFLLSFYAWISARDLIPFRISKVKGSLTHAKPALLQPQSPILDSVGLGLDPIV